MNKTTGKSQSLGTRIAPSRLFLGCVLGLLAMCLPLVARCEPGVLGKILGINMNEVAVKIIELPERESDLIILGVDINPDGNRIAVQSGGEKINIWDWRNHRIETTIEKPQSASNLMVTNPLQYSPTGNLLASCFTGAVGGMAGRIWSTASWSIAKDIADGTGCIEMRFVPDGKVLLRLSDVRKSSVDNLVGYSTDTWQPVLGLRIPLAELFSLAISPDGSLAAVGGRRFVVPREIEDPIKRSQQATLEPEIHIVNLRERRIISTTKSAAMGPMAWSPDGTRLAVAGETYLDIFDVQSGECLVHERVEKSGNMNVRYTPDGRYLIQSDLNGRGAGLGVKIWATQTHKLMQEIPGDIGSIAVSRDSKYLAIGATGRTTIWQFK
jgi:WD40 repeat protein